MRHLDQNVVQKKLDLKMNQILTLDLVQISVQVKKKKKKLEKFFHSNNSPKLSIKLSLC